MTNVVYFAEAPDGAVKIGTTNDLKARVTSLRTALPGIKILASVEGDHSLESHLHETFADDRIEREWFRKSDAISRLIDQIKALGADAIPAGYRPAGPAPVSRTSRADMLVVASRLVKIVPEPLEIGDTVKIQITRAARRLGLPAGRTENVWRREARTIPAEEYEQLLAGATAHARQPNSLRYLLAIQLARAEGFTALLDAARVLGALGSAVDGSSAVVPRPPVDGSGL